MNRPPLTYVRAVGFGLVATLLLLFALLAIPVYTAFMVMWMRVPLVDVLALSGPVAVISLLLAAAAIGAARRQRGVVP